MLRCAILSLLVGCCFHPVLGFAGSIVQQRQRGSSAALLHHSHCGVFIKLEASKTNGETENTEEKHAKKESLIFSAIANMSTEPLPSGTSKEDVALFLQQPENRNLLLSSGGSRPVEEMPLSPELESLWKELCQKEYGLENLPSPGDVVLACDSIAKFPGLKMVTTTISGVKYSETKTGYPQYSFFLIGEKQSISGLPPVVYMFNKLTGMNKKGDSLKPSGVAASIVSLQETAGDDDENLVINFDANIKITVEFPAFLLKILPVSKEKAEEQGSASILKSVKPSLDQSLTGVYDAFLDHQKAK